MEASVFSLTTTRWWQTSWPPCLSVHSTSSAWAAGAQGLLCWGAEAQPHWGPQFASWTHGGSSRDKQGPRSQRFSRRSPGPPPHPAHHRLQEGRCSACRVGAADTAGALAAATTGHTSHYFSFSHVHRLQGRQMLRNGRPEQWVNGKCKLHTRE